MYVWNSVVKGWFRKMQRKRKSIYVLSLIVTILLGIFIFYET